jgi:hypothetical protein
MAARWRSTNQLAEKKNKSERIKGKRGQNGPNQEMDCDGCASFFFCDSRLMDGGEQRSRFVLLLCSIHSFISRSCQVHGSSDPHTYLPIFWGACVAMLMEGGTDASNLFGRVGIEINGRSIEPALIADSVVSGRLR